MENASKAIMIAGGVLIGVLILSMFVYVFRAAARTNQSYDENQIQKQLEAYNSQFEIYNKDSNTISELLTLINLAYHTNSNYNYEPQNSVAISINIGSKYFNIVDKLDSNKNPIIKKNMVLSSVSENSINGDLISIYDLINKTFSELGINTTNSDITNDTLIKCKLTPSGKTIYKYLFKCDNIDYHKENGKISYMKFSILRYKYWSNDIVSQDDQVSTYSTDYGQYYIETLN